MKNSKLPIYILLVLFCAIITGCSKEVSCFKLTFVEQESGNSTTLDCRSVGKTVQLSVEAFCDFTGIGYEFCGRCGNISVTAPVGDVVLVEWDSNGFVFQNKNGSVKLKVPNVYEDGKTYAQLDAFLKVLGYGIVEKNDYRVIFSKTR